jgi:DNA-binding response OmpR family regulator
VIRLLLIDDEVRKAEPLISYFREVREWSADMASGPDQALELLRTEGVHPYDVIILDFMMDPGAAIPRDLTNGGRDTGLILLEMITKHTGNKVPVIVYTARTDLEYLKSDSRIAAYIQKPASARAIARAIGDLLSKPKS